MSPFDVAPQVQEQEGHRHQQQAQSHRGGCGAGTHGVHLSVAGLNGEAPAIFLEHLMRRELELADDDVGEADQPLTLIAPFGVITDDKDREGLLSIEATGTCVGGLITCTSVSKQRLPPLGPRWTRGKIVGNGCGWR